MHVASVLSHTNLSLEKGDCQIITGGDELYIFLCVCILRALKSRFRRLLDNFAFGPLADRGSHG